MAILRTIALISVSVSTILLRLGAYIYLQWIPFHLLWPAIIFFWIIFILSFILLLYLDLGTPSEPTITLETTDVIEIVSDGAEQTIVETEVDALIVEQPRQTTWMETVYLGIPNMNPLLSFLTIAVNAGLLMMTLDLTFRTYLFYPGTDLMFHRPVPTSPFSTNIFIRSPPESPLPLRVFYKPVDVASWHAGPVAYEFENTTDFTSVVTLDGLAPSTSYDYAVLPPDVDIDTANTSSFGSFETFPHHGKHGRWSFGSSSCILPHVPYNPLDHPLRIQGLEYLQKDMPNLKFFTFLGPPNPTLQY
jgi:alkaline phosphatase D